MILDRIRRVTRDGRWIPEIDGLRFIAIMSVVLFHINGQLRVRAAMGLGMEPRYQWLTSALNNGDRGVELFFVISGMILAMPFARHYLTGGRKVSLRKFYVRRLTRLEPPYVLSVLLLVGLFAVYTHGHVGEHYAGHVFATLFYVHSLTYHTMSPVNPATWSLEVEIGFYILAPLIMQIFRVPGKTMRRSILALSVIVILISQRTLAPEHWWGVMTLVFSVQYFIIGLLVADIMLLDLPKIPSSRWWDLIAVAVLVFMAAYPRQSWVGNFVLPYLYALLCLAAMRSLLFRKFVSAPWIAVLGGMCYSIYLLHFALLALFFKVTRYLILPQFDYAAIFVTQAIAIIVPTLAVAAGFFVLIERPCMDPDWPGKLWHRLTGRSMHDVDALDTAGVAPDQVAEAK